MVSLDLIHASNAQLRELGPGLVALFVGGTSGIGEYTLKAFVQNTISPRVYLIGRSAPAAERIIQECQILNKDGKVEFLPANVSELGEVDRVCKEIMKKESKINLLVQSQGNMAMSGRDESHEGIDKKMSLSYYSRMRFINNLLPLLTTASTTAPHFSRSLSILSAGWESTINLSDLELKKSFSLGKCADHTITMNSLMTTEFAKRNTGTSFVHSYPSSVNTGLSREMPFWARTLVKIATPLFKPFFVGNDETGARQLFLATSGIYPPLKTGMGFSAGMKRPKGMEVAMGTDGVVGSGGYLGNWTGAPAVRKQVLAKYMENGVSGVVWDHTMGIFERVEKVNAERIKKVEV
ncbi:NAD(P)-binding Rossmann-fold containing protein [Glarea lozoyensis ATCC 20868]|uniref:NAD(P)-binding Rossmann-fold containing protein n=1 Tax=Glarea lozoyensis (strain ATCC 20868 / MF5171) TaxID=1116229 RepID=S3CXR9_GLAL2|nr:NAD(P)-binding Rossmann-fold containing protein [Glarea lozoyensis ATCC 20868]EPE31137.1 NAD(P)-binding Rossmann-fold containing protein [Glarea lozoyensis ATCC 20868]